MRSVIISRPRKRHCITVEPLQKDDKCNDFASRRAILSIALLVATAVVLYLCCQIIRPFVAVLSWALALTIVTYPIYRRINYRLERENLAAGLTVLIVAVGVIAPASFVLHQLVREAAENIQFLTQKLGEGGWQEAISAAPAAQGIMQWLDANLEMRTSFRQLLESIGGQAPALLASSIWSVIQLFLVLFATFFLFRDRNLIVSAARELLPLSRGESDDLFLRVEHTVHATVYGTLTVAAIQGALGGLMFWVLGLPAAVLWGLTMALLSMIPYLGAFVVWVPAAVYLAIQGSIGKALILTLWGGVVVALIDNFLYPLLVGKKLRMHTLLVFFFILGGVTFFGAAGLVLGPVTLAVADALLQVWKTRLKENA